VNRSLPKGLVHDAVAAHIDAFLSVAPPDAARFRTH
jgi:hypothetical protein